MLLTTYFNEIELFEVEGLILNLNGSQEKVIGLKEFLNFMSKSSLAYLVEKAGGKNVAIGLSISIPSLKDWSSEL